MTNPRVLNTNPCHNEALLLGKNVESVRRFCVDALGEFHWELLIADNASTDETGVQGKALAESYLEVRYLHLAEKGRGNALRTCWLGAEADIYLYMDADLATELRHLPELLAAIRSGAGVAVGSRLVPGARVLNRAWSRELSSRGYNLCLKLLFRVKFRDAQCGFKAISRAVRDEIVPCLRDNHWFFDSELLILAERRGLPIREIPVTWRDNQVRDSKVRLCRDIVYFVGRMLELRRRMRGAAGPEGANR